FFSARDAYHTENLWRTDLALNYARPLNGVGKHTELFLKAELQNLFDTHKLTNFTDVDCGTGGCVNTSVLTRNNATQYAAFNPFPQAPVQGVNWALGSDFGKATSRYAFQTPRSFRFAVGFRF